MSQYQKEVVAFFVGAIIVIGLIYWIVCALDYEHKKEEKAKYAYEQSIYEEGYRDGYNDAENGDYNLEY